MLKTIQKGLTAAFMMMVLLVPQAALASGDAVSELNLPKEVAKVNGVAIQADHIKFEFNRIMENLPQPPTQSDKVKIVKAIIDKEVVRELVHQQGVKKKIEVDPKEVDQNLQALKKGYQSNGDWEKALKERDIDESVIRNTIKVDLTARKLLEERVRGKIKITDEQVKTFYEENQSRFNRPEAYRAQHIFIAHVPAEMRANTPQDKIIAQAEELRAKAKKKIEAVQKELTGGAKFEDLAKKYSEDSASASNGGNLDFIYKGVFDQSFDEAVSKLEKGQVSDVVETRFGFHIIKLNETKPSETVPFDEIKDELRKFLFTEEAKKVVSSYVNSLRKKADIELLYNP